MSLKIEFVERASKRGANVSALCREYQISRETGHKWLKRFRKLGHDGLEEHSRRPSASPLATAEDVVVAVLKAREAHPRWGPKKLVGVVQRGLKSQAPSKATIARILKRFGMVKARRRRPPVSVIDRVPDVCASACNDIWTVDFKGWWRTRDGARCEPLTVRDAHSRFVLASTLVEATTIEAVRREFERLFRRFGVPAAIQCDNGAPFICVQSRAGLTQLSAWWVSLGIAILRSRPGCPQDNGGHERMHRDMKADVQAFPGESRLAEQHALDRWRQEFNHVRPHEALGGKTPAELYSPGQRRSLRPLKWTYPTGWLCRRVYGPVGRISIGGATSNLGRPFIGLTVGVEPRSENSAMIWLHDVELGEILLAPPTATIDAACTKFIQGGHRRKKAA